MFAPTKVIFIYDKRQLNFFRSKPLLPKILYCVNEGKSEKKGM